MARFVWFGWALLAGLNCALGAEVAGRVRMPETCSPSVSPAVVALEPRSGQPVPAVSPDKAPLTLVRQTGLLFVPRVQAIQLGQSITFTNEDAESHSVHNVGAGTNFDLLMAPGQRLQIKPDQRGVVQLVCDVHSHMRAFVVVSASPWFAVCGADGRFRIRNVPEGLYRLRVWHEMGDPLVRTISVRGSVADLGVLEVTGGRAGQRLVLSAAARPWAQVIDRIGVGLSASIAAARTPGGSMRARTLVDDAYFGEFEASQMETAVRMYLGFQRAGALEADFRALRADVAGVAANTVSPAHTADRMRSLIGGLMRAGDELNRKGVVDGSKIDLSAAASQPASPAPTVQGSTHYPPMLLAALERALQSVQALADAGRSDEAAAALTGAYFEAFEPIELALSARGSSAALRLEARFPPLRAQIRSGLRGATLAESLHALLADTSSAFEHTAARSYGGFAAAFGASLITILREGIEVILLLTMLLALVAKTGQTRFQTAIRWGIGAAAVASVLTALALKLLLVSAQGRAREVLEGVVMLVASGVLFYVSYWLISRAEARRWAEFLKRHACEGAALGSVWTIGLTAFLAVYREGAETALMYHALFGSQATRLGELGLIAGLLVGAGMLAVLYVLLKSASVRLPLQAFFKLSGLALFAMAVVFAGKAVFDLQVGGVLRVTNLNWMGTGLPLLGLYPSVQVVAVQGLLVAGALLAVPMLWVSKPAESRPAPSRPAPSQSATPAAV